MSPYFYLRGYMEKKTTVYIIESERGWGQRVDEKKEFDSRKDAEDFVTEYNSYNNKEIVPDWYMYARIVE